MSLGAINSANTIVKKKGFEQIQPSQDNAKNFPAFVGEIPHSLKELKDNINQ